MNLIFSPDDYDARGQLRLPLTFWAILLLQSRTWLLFVIAGASRQQGSSLLELFYPDNQAFWLGLGSGVPAVSGLLLSGHRQRYPRIWQLWRWVLILTLLVMLMQQIFTLCQGEGVSFLSILLPFFDLLALAWLSLNRRVRACFDPASNAG